MAEMKFTIGSDYSQVVEGLNKVYQLERQIEKLGNTPAEIKIKQNLGQEIDTLRSQLSSTMGMATKQFSELEKYINGISSKGAQKEMHQLEGVFPDLMKRAQSFGEAFTLSLGNVHNQIQRTNEEIASTQEQMRKFYSMSGSGDASITNTKTEEAARSLEELYARKERLIQLEKDYQHQLGVSEDLAKSLGDTMTSAREKFGNTSGGALFNQRDTIRDLNGVVGKIQEGTASIEEMRSAITDTEGDLSKWNSQYDMLVQKLSDARLQQESYREMLSEMSANDPDRSVIENNLAEIDNRVRIFTTLVEKYQTQIGQIEALRSEIQNGIVVNTPKPPTQEEVRNDNFYNGDISTIEKQLSTLHEGFDRIAEIEAEIEEKSGGIAEKYFSWMPFISNNKEEITALEEELNKVKERVEEVQTVYSKGNDNVLQSSIKAHAESIDLDKLTTYTNGDGNIVEIPVYFKTEEAFKQFNDFVDKIKNLQSAIANYSGDNAGLEALKAELDSTVTEFQRLQTEANASANSLNGKMRSSVINASNSVYDLNNAVRAQEDVVANAIEKVKEYEKALAEANNSNDADKIRDAQQALAEANTEYEKSVTVLHDLKAKQSEAESGFEKITARMRESSTHMVKLFGNGDIDAFRERVNSMPLVFRELVTATQEAEVGFAEFKEGISNFAEGAKEKMGNAKAAFTAAGGGVKGFGAALKALAFNPVGIAIMAVVAALKLLQSWFNNTEKGQRTFAYLSGLIGGILKKVADIGYKVMDALYDMFDAPTKGGKKFASIMLDAVVASIKASFAPLKTFIDLVSTVFDSKMSLKEKAEAAGKIVKGFAQTYVDAYSKIKDVITNSGTAFDKGFGKGSNFHKQKLIDLNTDDIRAYARANMEERTEGLRETQAMTTQKYDDNGKEVEEGGLTIMERRQRMMENRLKFRDSSLSAAERKKAIAEYESDLKLITDVEKKFANERLERQKFRNDFSSSSLEDIVAEEKLKGASTAIDIQATAQKRVLTMAKNGADAMARQQAKNAEDLKTIQNKFGMEMAKLVRDNENAIEQTRIDAMDEGAAKTLAQLKLNHKKELDAVTEYELQLKEKNLNQAKTIFYKKNPKGIFKATVNDIKLTTEQEDSVKAKTNEANSKFETGRKKLFNSVMTPSEKIEEQKRKIKENIKALEDEVKELEKAEGVDKKRIDLLKERIKYLKENNDIAKQERDSSIEFLKEFGNVSQQIEAIKLSYQTSIDEALAKNDFMGASSAMFKRDQQISNIQSEQGTSLLKKVDWYTSLSDVGSVFKSQLKDIFSELTRITQKDEFSSLSADQQKQITDAITKLRTELGGRKVSYREIVNAVNQYQEVIRQYETEHQHFLDETNKLQQEYLSLLTKLKSEQSKEGGGNKKTINTLQNTISNVLEKWTELYKKDKNAESKVKAKSVELTQKQQDLSQYRSRTTQFFQNAGLGRFGELFEQFDILRNNIQNLKAIYAKNKEDKREKLKGKDKTKDKEKENKEKKTENRNTVANATESAVQTLGKTGESSGNIWGMIIGTILRILDILKDGIGKLVRDILQEVGQAVGGIIKDIYSGQFFKDIGSGIVELLGGIFGYENSNKKDIEESNQKLEDSINTNTAAIQRLTEQLKEGSAADKTRAYNETRSLKKANEEDVRQKMINNASMYDGGHSLSYQFNENFTYELKSRLTNLFGQGFNSLTEILSISAETMSEKFYSSDYGRKTLNMLKQAIRDAEDTENYNGLVEDLTQYIDDYSADSYKQLKKQLQESVTGISFDNFVSNFKSALMDMEKDTNDFANDFTQKLTQSIIDSQIEKKYGAQIQSLYDEWYDVLSDDVVNEVEVNRLNAMQENLTNLMMNERDKIAALTGYDDVSSGVASGSVNSAKAMSEDTANELVGRATAIQLAQENGNAILSAENQVLANLQMMMAQSVAQNTTYIENNARALEDIQTILAESYIELKGINENTLSIVKPIKDMSANMETMRQKIDTL